MTSRFVSRRAVLAASTLALWLPGHARSGAGPAKKNLLIGATAGSNYDLLQKGIVPQLQKKGYQIKLIEFNDYVSPIWRCPTARWMPTSSSTAPISTSSPPTASWR
jgi:D-methionine transport system substrate-binding protein